MDRTRVTSIARGGAELGSRLISAALARGHVEVHQRGAAARRRAEQTERCAPSARWLRGMVNDKRTLYVGARLPSHPERDTSRTTSPRWCARTALTQRSLFLAR